MTWRGGRRTGRATWGNACKTAGEEAPERSGGWNQFTLEPAWYNLDAGKGSGVVSVEMEI